MTKRKATQTTGKQNPKIECVFHPGDYLVCATCEGAKGGHSTAQKHRGKHSEWGKLGGRPKRRLS